jgi:hypothetical protein
MRNNIGTYWTVREMDQLDELVAEGRSFKEISLIVGRSASACKNRYYMIKVGKLHAGGNLDDTLISTRTK